MEPVITLEKNQAIAVLSFNRPEAMNTYNYQMGEQLLAATEELLWDDTIRVVLLKGVGPVFMAGGDISFFKERQDKMPYGVIDIVRLLAGAIQNLQNMSKPVVAAVHGAVAGAGISLMLAADLIIAHEETKFTLAYSGLGTCPDGGASYFLPRVVGEKKAMELLMLSDRFTAKQAEQWGMINKVVDQLNFNKEVDALVNRLAHSPTFALGKIKQLVYQARHNSFAQQLELEATSFAKATQTADFKKGVNAFLEKKIAEFKGN